MKGLSTIGGVGRGLDAIGASVLPLTRAHQVERSKKGPDTRGIRTLSHANKLVREQAILVSLRKLTGNAHFAALNADGLEVGNLGLPLGTARAGIAAGHLALGYCHDAAPLNRPTAWWRPVCLTALTHRGRLRQYTQVFTVPDRFRTRYSRAALEASCGEYFITSASPHMRSILDLHRECSLCPENPDPQCMGRNPQLTMDG